MGDVACLDILEKRSLADLPAHSQFTVQTVLSHKEWKVP